MNIVLVLKTCVPVSDQTQLKSKTLHLGFAHGKVLATDLL